MSDGNEESLDDLECDCLASAKTAQVAIARNIKNDYDNLTYQQLGRFQRILEMWCQEHNLPPTMWNSNEGRSPVYKVLIQAAKITKVRLYGFVRSVQGVKTFIIVDLDPAKKQNKADPIVLKRAKDRADKMGKRKKK